MTLTMIAVALQSLVKDPVFDNPTNHAKSTMMLFDLGFLQELMFREVWSC